MKKTTNQWLTATTVGFGMSDLVGDLRPRAKECAAAARPIGAAAAGHAAFERSRAWSPPV